MYYIKWPTALFKITETRLNTQGKGKTKGCEKLFNTYWIFEETNKVGYSPSLYHHPGLHGVAGGDVGQGPGSLEEHRIGLRLVR